MKTENKPRSLRIYREHLLDEPCELSELSFGGRRAVLHEGLKVLAPKIRLRLRQTRAGIVTATYERCSPKIFTASPRLFTSGGRRILVRANMREDTRGFFETLIECTYAHYHLHDDTGVMSWDLAMNTIVLETDLQLG